MVLPLVNDVYILTDDYNN